MKPLFQFLEVPSYSSEKLTSPEDNFDCSTRIQAFIQLAMRMNSCLSTFVLPLVVTCTQSTMVCGICFFSANSGIKFDNQCVKLIHSSYVSAVSYSYFWK